MKKKLSKLELALKKITAALQAYVNDHIADIENPHGVTKTQIGLENVTNDSQVKRSEMGVADGVATLDANGKVPASQLPSSLAFDGTYNAGTNKAATVSTVTSRMVASYNAVSTNQSNIATSLTVDGCENKVYYNSGSSDITLGITTGTNVIAVDGVDSITLSSGAYAEINFLRVTTSGTTRVFIRSIS